jgi:hypothetical protein
MAKATPRYLNVVPKSTLLGLKVESAISDLKVIAIFISEGAVAADDLEAMLDRMENLTASVNEMRVGMEISADARSVTDDEYEQLVDDYVDDLDEDD